jgi:hypothetical protein
MKGADKLTLAQDKAEARAELVAYDVFQGLRCGRLNTFQCES